MKLNIRKNKVLAYVGLGLVVVMFLFGTLGGAVSHFGCSSSAPEKAVEGVDTLTSQVRAWLEEREGRELKKCVFYDTYAMNSAGIYLTTEYSAASRRVQELDDILFFATLPHERREVLREQAALTLKKLREEYREKEMTARDSVKVASAERRLSEYRRLAARKKVDPKDIALLSEQRSEAQRRFEAIESTPGRVYVWEFKYKGDKDAYRIYFVSPVDRVELNLMDVKPLTFYKPQ